MKNKLYLIAFLLLLSGPYWAKDLYVATNGTDNGGVNYGTITKPYKTITFASQKAVPGDNVYVRGGEYRNTNYGNGIWNNENAVRIACIGTATDYISFQPYQNELVKIKFDGNYGILIQSAAYVRVQGFEIEGMNDSITLNDAWNNWGLYINPNESGTPIHNLATEIGINPQTQPIGTTVSKPSFAFSETRPAYYNGRGLVANKSHHIEILNNKVYNCPSSGIRADVCDYITVAGNEVYNNTWYTSSGVGAITFSGATNIIGIDYNNTETGVKMIIKNNNVHDNENRLVSWNGQKNFITFEIDEGSGIFLTRNNDEAVPVEDRYNYGQFLITNNISYRNGASGIVVHKTDKTTVEFNTVYKNGTSNTGDPGGIGINDSNDVTIRNNISYAKPDKFAIGKVGGVINNLTVVSNILFNENGTTGVISKIDNTNTNNLTVGNNGLWVTNPLLKDPDIAAANLKLQSTSPAINKAVVSSFSILDYDGVGRDANPDIGAFEFQNNLATDAVIKNDRPILYPNPAFDHVIVEGNNLSELKCFSLEGKDCSKSLRITQLTAKKIKIELSVLLPGIYFLKIKDQSLKLLKH